MFELSLRLSQLLTPPSPVSRPAHLRHQPLSPEEGGGQAEVPRNCQEAVPEDEEAPGATPQAQPSLVLPLSPSGDGGRRRRRSCGREHNISSCPVQPERPQQISPG